MDSILLTIKHMLGIEAEYNHFDQDVMFNINTVLMTSNQIGIGPAAGFLITGEAETWVDLLGERIDLEAIKSYIYLKVRLLFDPPSSSFVLDAMQRQATEIEWRLWIQVENTAYTPEVLVEEEV